MADDAAAGAPPLPTITEEAPAPEPAAAGGTVAAAAPGGGGGGGGGASETEKKLAHYKRLIMQSRQMLETYQKQLAEKDKLAGDAAAEAADLRLRLKQVDARNWPSEGGECSGAGEQGEVLRQHQKWGWSRGSVYRAWIGGWLL